MFLLHHTDIVFALASYSILMKNSCIRLLQLLVGLEQLELEVKISALLKYMMVHVKKDYKL